MTGLVAGTVWRGPARDYLLVRNAWGPAEGVACSATPTAAAAAAAGAGLFNAPLVALMERLQRVLHPPPPPAAPPLTDRVKAVARAGPAVCATATRACGERFAASPGRHQTLSGTG